MKNTFLLKSISDIHKSFVDGSCTPEDIASECISAYEKYNSSYFPFVCFDSERLLQQAGETSKRLSQKQQLLNLDGIPVGVKDIFNTADFPTQMGSPLWKGFTPGNDARTVFNVKEQGALIPGKTVTAEFAVHTLNETINPHDETRTPGTSSSGSAVAIALGIVPVALGTQTAASIVRPASFCGVYGCKPSFGLIPRTGMLKTTDSLDSVGFFTSRYEDIRRVFEVLRVHGPNYPKSHQAFQDPARVRKPEIRPWRVAFAKTHTWENAPQYAKSAIVAWLNKVSATGDIEVIEPALPEQIADAHRIHSTIYDKTLAYYFAKEFERSELISPIMNDMIRHGNEITPEEYLSVLEEQSELCLLMDEFCSGYDVLISLSTAGSAPPRHQIEEPDPSLMWTLTHLPVVSVPVFLAPDGLPFGLQITSRRYNDYLLLNFTDHLRSLGLIPEGVNPLSKPCLL
ncbi:amidase [Geobacter sp.]|uniref:amidase n=1 Tax=Geobacter sp. TaxID=46610 RepID=UPI0027BA5DF3|nr:amidase [Geobacter sp.]